MMPCIFLDLSIQNDCTFASIHKIHVYLTVPERTRKRKLASYDTPVYNVTG